MKKITLILTLIILSMVVIGCTPSQTPNDTSAPSSDNKAEVKTNDKTVTVKEIASKSEYGPDYGQECGYIKDTEKKICRCVGDSEIGKDQKIYCKGTCDTASCKCYNGRDEVPCLTTS